MYKGAHIPHAAAGQRKQCNRQTSDIKTNEPYVTCQKCQWVIFLQQAYGRWFVPWCLFVLTVVVAKRRQPIRQKGNKHYVLVTIPKVKIQRANMHCHVGILPFTLSHSQVKCENTPNVHFVSFSPSRLALFTMYKATPSEQNIYKQDVLIKVLNSDYLFGKDVLLRAHNKSKTDNNQIYLENAHTNKCTINKTNALTQPDMKWWIWSMSNCLTRVWYKTDWPGKIFEILY